MLIIQIAVGVALGIVLGSLALRHLHQLVAVGMRLGAWLVVLAVLVGAVAFFYARWGTAGLLDLATLVVTLFGVGAAVVVYQLLVQRLMGPSQMSPRAAKVVAWLCTFSLWEFGAVLIWWSIQSHNRVPFTDAWQTGIFLYVAGSIYMAVARNQTQNQTGGGPGA